MKRLLLAGALAAMCVTPALAQTEGAPAAAQAPAVAPATVPLPEAIAACGAFPTAPALPDLQAIKNSEVPAVQTQVQVYLPLAFENLQCRQAAIQAERAALNARGEVLNAQIVAFNADREVQEKIGKAWNEFAESRSAPAEKKRR